MATWLTNENILKQLRDQAALGGGPQKIDKQHSAGKLTARERIQMLFDSDTFVEIGGLIEPRIKDFPKELHVAQGDGIVTGYGKINGRLVCAAVSDFTVMGGTLGEAHASKICRILDIALEMRVPFLSVNDSGGARIEEGINSLSGYAGVFLRNTKASGVIPQIAVMVGPCAGGACYSPAICDFIFMVRGIAKMFITGPKVVQHVIGEKCTVDELGGAEVHDKISGVTHFTYEDEQSCFDGVRKLLEYLPQNSESSLPLAQPVYNDRCSTIRDIVPANSRKTYDVHHVLDCIVDTDSFMEIQKNFARNIVIGFARMNGQPVGIVANQPLVLAGALDCDSSDKAARFIRTCDCFGIPVLTLVDVPAFFPGTSQEHNGIIRHGAKLLFAYSEATVPKITLIMRKAYGGAYIAMNSKGIGADIVYAWPIAEIAVMGAEGAVEIMCKRELDRPDFTDEILQKKIEDYQNEFMNPFIAAKYGFVDEIICAEETRTKLCAALELVANKKILQIPKKHGNIPL